MGDCLVKTVPTPRPLKDIIGSCLHHSHQVSAVILAFQTHPIPRPEHRFRRFMLSQRKFRSFPREKQRKHVQNSMKAKIKLYIDLFVFFRAPVMHHT